MSELRPWFAVGRLQLQGSCHKVKADKVLSAATIPASWHSSWGIYSSFHQSPSRQSYAHFDGLSWLFQFTTWQYTDVHKLSIQKWLFNNTVVLFFLRSVLEDLWAITQSLLVKSLSGQVEENGCVGVMKDSHSERCKRNKWKRINRKLVAVFRLLWLWHIELKWLNFCAPWCFCGKQHQRAAVEMLGAYFKHKRQEKMTIQGIIALRSIPWELLLVKHDDLVVYDIFFSSICTLDIVTWCNLVLTFQIVNTRLPLKFLTWPRFLGWLWPSCR